MDPPCAQSWEFTEWKTWRINAPSHHGWITFPTLVCRLYIPPSSLLVIGLLGPCKFTYFLDGKQMPATPQDQWYHFWPDWPTGTLRVDLIVFEQICYCFVRALSLIPSCCCLFYITIVTILEIIWFGVTPIFNDTFTSTVTKNQKVRFFLKKK